MRLVCSKCSLDKPITHFHKNKKGKFGVKAHCKSCCALIAKTEDKTKRQKASSNYKKTNKNKVNAYNKLYRLNNPIKAKNWSKKSSLLNKQSINARCRQRKDYQKLASIGDFKNELEAIYEEALTLEQDGIRRHVHHEIPLRQYMDKVCGLHVPWNLKILTEEEHYDEHRRLEDLYNPNGTE